MQIEAVIMTMTTMIFVSIHPSLVTCWLIESLTEGGTQPGSGDDERDDDDSSVSSVKKKQETSFYTLHKLKMSFSIFHTTAAISFLN